MIEPAVVQIIALIFILAAAPGLLALVLFVRGLALRVEELESLRLLDAAERGKLQQELDELRRGIGVLIAQIRRAGMTPEWIPAPPAPAPDPRGQKAETERQVHLYQMIEHQFDMDEMLDLAFRLELPDISRTETVGARSRALVMHAKRRHKGNELIALCRAERPDGGF